MTGFVIFILSTTVLAQAVTTYRLAQSVAELRRAASSVERRDRRYLWPVD